MSLPMDRPAALELLHSHTQGDFLRKHGLCVEATMRHFAEIYNEDADWWGMVGLLHDLDFEEFPEQHCQKTEVFLKDAGFDADFIRAVMAHGYGSCTDVVPEKMMEKVIYAVDELTGFITACALMRPSKSVMDLETKSVKKKFKQLSFAAAIDRGIITDGAERMGVELDFLIDNTILALRKVADDIGFGMAE